MIDLCNNYSDRISLDGKRIFVEGKVVHTNKSWNILHFYLIIIGELLVIFLPIFYHFNLVEPGRANNYVFYILFIVIAVYLTYEWVVLIIDMIFVNKSYIDYGKNEISIINVFGKKSIYYIKDYDSLEFYYRIYFWNGGFFYKIILKYENTKFVIMRDYFFKSEVKKICDFLNNFKNYNTRE